MKIWFDADNGPHVLIIRPLIAELRRRGHEVVCTSRNRTRTPELMDLYGLPHEIVGGEYAPGMAGKVRGTLGRAWSLARTMRGDRIDVCFGHGSRALPLAARLLGIPAVTMYDYEWVNARIFNWTCRSILLPDVITPERCREAGIAVDKAVGYPGYKEELYLGSADLDPTVAADLGLRDGAVHALLRPPATTAHYHNPEAEVIFERILRKLAEVRDLQLVFLPRTADQVEQPRAAGVSEVIVPDKVYDGPSLVGAMDLMISGGGTMTREAAILGVPSYSFFRGRAGQVDESLAAAGRLVMLPDAASVESSFVVAKRERAPRQPDPERLVGFIVDTILTAAGS